MVEEGLFERFPSSQVFGMHNWPSLPAGEFAVHDGPVMASADRFEITLKGRGGHGAMPHQTRDVIVAGSQLVTALQTIVSRTVDPVAAAVVTVTRFNAGSTFNVIPSQAELWGTTRSFDPAVRDAIESRMKEIVDGIASTYGVEAELVYRRGYPSTVNTSAEAEIAATVARRVVGEERVHRDLPPTMGAEDFAYMLQATPGCYVWLGGGRGTDDPGLHHPCFDFNDEILPIGASYWATLVETRLAVSST
jgi:hippurate hydrolase